MSEEDSCKYSELEDFTDFPDNSERVEEDVNIRYSDQSD